jgi:hypothetical protein
LHNKPFYFEQIPLLLKEQQPLKCKSFSSLKFS